LGAELLQRPPTGGARVGRGALLPFECLRKTRVVQALRSSSGRPGRGDGRACPPVPGRGEVGVGVVGGGGRCFSQPTGHAKCARIKP
jgi:hypothetical protein